MNKLDVKNQKNVSWRYDKSLNFDRVAYLKLVREIGADIKGQFGECAYWRIFSEPRKKNIYRSKFWASNVNKNVAKYIQQKYGDKVSVYTQQYTGRGYYSGRYINVCINPVASEFELVSTKG